MKALVFGRTGQVAREYRAGTGTDPAVYVCAATDGAGLA